MTTPAQREAVARKLEQIAPQAWGTDDHLKAADEIIAAHEAAAWQPIETLPEGPRLTVYLWSTQHVQNGQDPYPGGGWHRTVTGLMAIHRAAFAELGYTHWRLPSAPPKDPAHD